jgi:phospholipid-binding lipoprotein MlaA
VQQAISNLVSNLTEPLTAGSSLVQGDFDNAATATSRFLVNTTIGIGGIRDPATDLGMEQRREDIGQALGAHGVPPGPHIVLPVLGPSNLRDAPGDILLGLLSPIPFAGQVGAGAVEYARNQDAIKQLGDSVVDPYVVERDAYEQHRGYLVHNGQKIPLPTIAEFE